MKLLSPDDVAERLAVSRGSVILLTKRGQLAFVRVGKSYRVAQEDVDEFVALARRPPGMLRSFGCGHA